MAETPEQAAHQAHPQKPSAKWLAHKAAIDKLVTRTAEQRAERMKERTDGTEYHRKGEPTTEGS